MHKLKVAMSSKQMITETIAEGSGGSTGQGDIVTAFKKDSKPKMGDFANKMKGGASRKSSAVPTSSSPAASISSISSATSKKKEVKKFGSSFTAFKSKISSGKKKRDEEVSRDASPKRAKDIKVRLFFQKRLVEMTDEEVLSHIGKENIKKEVGMGLDQLATVIPVRLFLLAAPPPGREVCPEVRGEDQSPSCKSRALLHWSGHLHHVSNVVLQTYVIPLLTEMLLRLVPDPNASTFFFFLIKSGHYI